MKPFRKFFMLGIVTMTIALPAQADSRMELTLGLGGMNSASDTTVAVPGTPLTAGGSWKLGPLFQTSLFGQAFPWLALGLQVGISHQTFDSTDPSLQDESLGGFTRLSRTVTQITPQFEVGPWIGNSDFRWKPYLTAGAGLYRVADAGTTATGDPECSQTCIDNGDLSCQDPTDTSGTCTLTCTNSCSDPSVTATQSYSETGFNVGGGILLQTGQHIAWGPDVQYHEVSGEDSFHYTTASMRLAFLF